jgi:putative RecB family exonuclease
MTTSTVSSRHADNTLETLSPSRASDFKVCPQLFKFKAIDRIKTPPTVYQARGTTAHLALQRLFDLPAAERTPEQLYDLFRQAWIELKPEEFADLFDSTDDERSWGIDSLEILANYFGVEDPTTFEPLDRELDMSEAVGSMTIRGILDRIDERPTGLVITDYKTGKAPPERYALPAFFALKIYALLVRVRTGRTPTTLRLIYLNGPAVYEIAVNDAQLDAMERHLHALWAAIERAIEREHFPPRPGPLCNWCSYKDLCPAWATDDTPAELLSQSAPAN